MSKIVEEIITVQELFQHELDTLNGYIVQLENQKKLDKETKKELKELRVVAGYLIRRINNEFSLVKESHTLH